MLAHAEIRLKKNGVASWGDVTWQPGDSMYTDQEGLVKKVNYQVEVSGSFLETNVHSAAGEKSSLPTIPISINEELSFTLRNLSHLHRYLNTQIIDL